MATGARRTKRNAHDAYLTPPCAAMAYGAWWRARVGPHIDDVLDPFAGPGAMLSWAVAVAAGADTTWAKPVLHAFERDARWAPELRRRVPGWCTRLGIDSFRVPWTVRGRAPHIVTNNPYGKTEQAVARLQAHAYEHRRWCAGLLRTDWWQHGGREQYRPDHFLLLEWRPSFSFRRDKAGKLGMGTDQAGYVWCVWAPERTGMCLTEFLPRPTVPKPDRAEHRRLARMAFDFGEQHVELAA